MNEWKLHSRSILDRSSRSASNRLILSAEVRQHIIVPTPATVSELLTLAEQGTGGSRGSTPREPYSSSLHAHQSEGCLAGRARPSLRASNARRWSPVRRLPAPMRTLDKAIIQGAMHVVMKWRSPGRNQIIFSIVLYRSPLLRILQLQPASRASTMCHVDRTDSLLL